MYENFMLIGSFTASGIYVKIIITVISTSVGILNTSLYCLNIHPLSTEMELENTENILWGINTDWSWG